MVSFKTLEHYVIFMIKMISDRAILRRYLYLIDYRKVFNKVERSI